MLKTDGYSWEDGKVLLNCITKSCKLKYDRVKTRLPIHKGLLELILFWINRKYGDSQPYLEAMYISCYLVAYYGLMRVGELAESCHSLKAMNIHESRNRKRLLLILYTSKTHGLNTLPQKIKIFGKQSIEVVDSIRHKNSYKIKSKDLGRFCPYEWTKKFIQMRKPITDQAENFYIFSDGSNVQPHHLRNLLRESLHSMNLDSSLYDTHSFRIGRATDLFKAGVNVEDIKQLGRWKSNAVYKYLRNC